MKNINICRTCPYCGSSHVNNIDDTLSYCMDCEKQIITIMKKSEISLDDNLNKKKIAKDDIDLSDFELQKAYSSTRFNIAEGYENIEATKTLEIINE